MLTKAQSALPLIAAAGLAMALFAASPAIKAAGLSGTALAADTPPAVAQPDGAANNEMAEDKEAVEAAPPATTPAADLRLQRSQYFYSSSRLRDPFGSLLSGRFVSDDEKRLPDVGAIDLLGVMWGDSDKFAMVEDKEGNGYVLRVGDPVVNGEVSGITRTSLIVRQYFFGTSTSVTLKLKPREGKADAKKDRR